MRTAATGSGTRCCHELLTQPLQPCRGSEMGLPRRKLDMRACPALHHRLVPHQRCGPPCAALQVVNSYNGMLTDAWTLTKPVGWQPNATRQSATVSNFVSNYTMSTWEQFGIGGGPQASGRIRPGGTGCAQ